MSISARRRSELPGAPHMEVPGFKRTYDPRIGMYSVRLQPGECYATAAGDETIVTVLGSCVAACIRDPWSGYGGMNHFMLPESETGEWSGVSAVLRYGNHAMEMLINAVLKAGCMRNKLEIKLFGGSNLYDGMSAVGMKNAEFALKYLEAEGLSVVATDLGGPHARMIHYTPTTGVVKRRFCRRTDIGQLVESEHRYKTKLKDEKPEGDIELFG